MPFSHIFLSCLLFNNLSHFPLHRPLCDPDYIRLWAAFWEGHRSSLRGALGGSGCFWSESFLCACTRQRQQGAEVLCTCDSEWRHLRYPWETPQTPVLDISWVSSVGKAELQASLVLCSLLRCFFFSSYNFFKFKSEKYLNREMINQ